MQKCSSDLNISPELEVAFSYLCCQPYCKVASHILLLCWFCHQSFRWLTPGLCWACSGPCGGPVEWPVCGVPG